MSSLGSRSFRVISGGQTGVDRGALDAALDLGVSCGGWCPDGRRAEDGIIPARYPLTELDGAGYDERTRRNVADSDDTLIITFGPASGGTARTIAACRELGRPHLIIDGSTVAPEHAAGEAVSFVREKGIARLNVAGPRARGEPRGHGYCYALVRVLCLQCAGSGANADQRKPA
ncbi:MAG TPA: putative molybdenum carrier protein [Steroidobacteraceae bacterium]